MDFLKKVIEKHEIFCKLALIALNPIKIANFYKNCTFLYF